MALPKSYDMSMASQASMIASNAKANLFDHSPAHPQFSCYIEACGFDYEETAESITSA